MKRPQKKDYCKYINDLPDWNTFDMNAYSIENDKYIDFLEEKIQALDGNNAPFKEKKFYI